MIQIPSTEPESIWRFLLELDLRVPHGWTLIGAQMVSLHAFENESAAPRASKDADILVDVRLVSGPGTEGLAAALIDLGLSFSGQTPDLVGHRYLGRDVCIDVLGPDNVGSRTRMTTSQGARTVGVPGGTQALRRTERVEVALGSRHGFIPRPDLLGAILVKARAVDVDDVPTAQEHDLAALLAMVRKPAELDESITSVERGWLRRRLDLVDRAHSGWAGIPGAEDGIAVLRLLASPK